MRKFACRAPALLLSILISTGPAAATTPPRLWQSATSLGVQCIVRREPFRHDPKLSAALCAQVAQIASRDASIPVSIVPLGDPALIAAGRASLLVHASVEPVRGERTLTFSIRPFSGSAEGAILFGAAPRAVALAESGLGGPALDGALSAALSEILPWRARSIGPQPVPGRD
jgi:hypothetical protein